MLLLYSPLRKVIKQDEKSRYNFYSNFFPKYPEKILSILKGLHSLLRLLCFYLAMFPTSSINLIRRQRNFFFAALLGTVINVHI